MLLVHNRVKSKVYFPDVSQFNGQAVTSFVQVSREIKFKYNPTAAIRSHLIELSINGTLLRASDTTTYKIATWDFLASGGDSFWPKQSNFITLDKQDKVFVVYLKQPGPLASQLDGYAVWNGLLII